MASLVDNNQQSGSLSTSQLYKRLVLVSFLMFAAGYIVTTVGVYVGGYDKMPLLGETRIRSGTGAPYFDAYFPIMRRFALPDNPAEAGTRSFFTEMGVIGTGGFFYQVVNAPHWIFEIKLKNLRVIVLIPIITIFIGCYLFFYKFLPVVDQTPENAVSSSLLLGFLYAVWIMLLCLTLKFTFPVYSQFFGSGRLYSGQFAGSILPFIVISMLTGLLYGSISGGLISFMRQLQLRIQLLHSKSS